MKGWIPILGIPFNHNAKEHQLTQFEVIPWYGMRLAIALIMSNNLEFTSALLKLKTLNDYP